MNRGLARVFAELLFSFKEQYITKIKSKKREIWFEVNYATNEDPIVNLPKKVKRFFQIFGNDCDALELAVGMEENEKIIKEYIEFFNDKINNKSKTI